MLFLQIRNLLLEILQMSYYTDIFYWPNNRNLWDQNNMWHQGKFMKKFDTLLHLSFSDKFYLRIKISHHYQTRNAANVTQAVWHHYHSTSANVKQTVCTSVCVCVHLLPQIHVLSKFNNTLLPPNHNIAYYWEFRWYLDCWNTVKRLQKFLLAVIMRSFILSYCHQACSLVSLLFGVAKIEMGRPDHLHIWQCW